MYEKQLSDALEELDRIEVEEARLDDISAGLGDIFGIGGASPFAARPEARSTPSLSAISQFFDFGGDSVSGTFPLRSNIKGWVFKVSVHGLLVDRTFAALNRRTRVGSVMLQGMTELDPRTRLGVSLKLGGAQSVASAPAATVNTTHIGADLAVLRFLSPNLFAGLYAGYQFGAHNATIAAVNSNFLSHAIKLGGVLQGEIDYAAFTLTPSISALLQYRHRPSFTDAAGVVVPLSNTVDLDITAGSTISRDFLFVEHGIVVSPFVGGNLLVDYSATTPAPAPGIPDDHFHAQVVGGVNVSWVGGAVLNLQAQVSKGANTTAYGVTSGLSVPIN
jgi:hypothetical protein